jgi:signal transduction histidine kinase
MQSFLSINPSEVVLTNRRVTQTRAIDAGRASAFSHLVNGEGLTLVLTELITALENAIRGVKCSIMLCDQESHTLSFFVGPSIPSTYAHAMYSLAIDERAGANARAAHTRQPVISANIRQDTFWDRYKTIASHAKLAACWAYPIISPSKKLLGTFSLYFEHPISPSEQNLDTIEKEAHVAAIIIERAQNIESLHKAKQDLQKKIDVSTRELEESNKLLSKALEQRNDVQKQLVEMENMASLGIMMSSLTHEINTPVGVSVTAISHLKEVQQKTRAKLDSNQLTRSELDSMFDEIDEAAFIIERNLFRSTELIKTFKQLSIDQHSADVRRFNVCDYINEILLSLKPRLKHTNLSFCIDVEPELYILSYPGAFSQILINLIMNSAIHGFKEKQAGRICIKMSRLDNDLCLDYSDNGKGMNQHTIDNIYKPFFTLGRSMGGTGLGMNVCYNLIVKLLKGTIDCESDLGQGVRFRVRFPQSSHIS